MTDFFEEREEQSRIKSEIVVSYFAAWATIMARRAPVIEYRDLFAGPGRYEDGEKTTPLLVAEIVVRDPLLRTKVRLIFNDAEEDYVERLRRELHAIPEIETLAFAPDLTNNELDRSHALTFRSESNVPALTFIDPWGYKGLTRHLIAEVVKDFGCEAIFFFNYSRINAAIENGLVEPHMEAMFAPEGLPALREALRMLDPLQREKEVLRAMGESLRSMPLPRHTGRVLLIPFRFARPGGRAHYIFFVTKHPRGYMIMKDVMARRGIRDQDGVPRFEYVPSWSGEQLSFEAARPLLLLPDDLLRRYAGRRLEVRQIVEEHNVGTPFIPKNYKDVLLKMEAEGRVECVGKSRRTPGTMADENVIVFPAR